MFLLQKDTNLIQICQAGELELWFNIACRLSVLLLSP
jgi:hypothetical protein